MTVTIVLALLALSLAIPLLLRAYRKRLTDGTSERGGYAGYVLAACILALVGVALTAEVDDTTRTLYVRLHVLNSDSRGETVEEIEALPRELEM